MGRNLNVMKLRLFPILTAILAVPLPANDVLHVGSESARPKPPLALLAASAAAPAAHLGLDHIT